MKKLKKNVKVFDKDVLANSGYRYTTKATYSAKVANVRLTNITIDILNSTSQKTLIDVGCGDGIYVHEIKKRFTKLKISAFDPAAQAISLAKKIYPNINFFVGNILDEKLPLKERYDIAVARGVLHHLDYPELAVKNTAKLADRVIIIEPNGNNPILKIIEKKSKYHIEHEEKSYSIKELKEFCKKTNYRIEKVRYVGFVPFFFPTTPSRVIHFFQPLLERIPIINHYFAAQIVLVIDNPRERN